MLPEIGGLELLVIAAVALIVVGPKDLPVMLRKLGQFTAKVRGMANEFRASFDEMARQSELDELRKEVEAMRRGQMAENAAAEASKAQVLAFCPAGREITFRYAQLAPDGLAAALQRGRTPAWLSRIGDQASPVQFYAIR